MGPKGLSKTRCKESQICTNQSQSGVRFLFSITNKYQRKKSDTHQVFDAFQELLEGDERQLGLQVLVLRQMAASPAGLCAVGRQQTETLAHCGTGGLQIQLRGLGQIGLREWQSQKNKNKKKAAFV
jgi:hypothetical protein